MSCHGICEQHKAQRKRKKGNVSTFYGHKDHKRCSTCTTYIQWSGDYCPCCGCQLRAKPRYRKRGKKEEKCKCHLRGLFISCWKCIPVEEELVEIEIPVPPNLHKREVQPIDFTKPLELVVIC